ncbi:hypothetical protein ACWEWU_03055 [Staphylococcus xylosus]
MAEFIVNHKYKDKELDRVLESGEKVEMTVKRAKYVNRNNKNKVEFLTRVEEDLEDEES